MERREPHLNWFAYVWHAVPADLLNVTLGTGAIGVAHNVGQCTDSPIPHVKFQHEPHESLNPDGRTGASWHGGRKGSNRRHRAGHTLRKLHWRQARGPR